MSHVSLHGTAKDYLIIAPFVVFCCKLFKRKVSLRKFAGSFYDIYSKSNFFFKGVYNYSLKRADYLFFETKYLVDKFKDFNSEVIWWPNSRRKPNLVNTNYNFRKKFVFISQVKKTKGVLEFIEASRSFDDSYCFDIYGPVMEEAIEQEIYKVKNVTYKGVLAPQTVCNTLFKYDVLVLPTYHAGEGYPGILIEAFACRIPVISTNWNSIPEILKDGINGFIVEPKNVGSLIKGIEKFSTENYADIAFNAIKFFDKFDSELIDSKFFKIIQFN